MQVRVINQRIINILLATYPILALYKVNELINLGDVILVLLILLTIVRDKFRIEINFFILILSLTGLNYINGFISGDMTSVINNCIVMIKFGVAGAILFRSKENNIELLYKCCSIVGVVSTVFLLYQVLIYNVSGEIVSGVLFEIDLIDNVLKSESWGRFSAFFGEPAHMAIYLAPILAMALQKEDYLITVVIATGMLLTTSSSGIVFIVVLITYKYFDKKENLNTKNIISAIVLVLFICIGYVFVTNNHYDNYSNKFTFEYFANNIRLFGGFEYLTYFNFGEWIFGIGINKLSTYGEINGFVAYNYANSLFYSIISFGLFGTFILFNWLWCIAKKIDKDFKSMFIILLLILVSDQVLFNWNLFYILIWIGTSYKEAVYFTNNDLDKKLYSL